MNGVAQRHAPGRLICPNGEIIDINGDESWEQN